MSSELIFVVPCFNEAARLATNAFLGLARAHADVRWLFVDDGSTDATRDVLHQLVDKGEGRIKLLALDKNVGKACAVQRGMRAALQMGAAFVGYTDADLSTPPSELLHLIDSMRSAPVDVLLASRVRLLGCEIERGPVRHYLGRVFAAAASIALDMPVYDTQCGAKLFRASPLLAEALEPPFTSRWIFDVELLARLTTSGGRHLVLREMPLRAWRDAGMSKLRLGAMFWAGFQLLCLLVRLGTARYANLRRPVDRNAPERSLGRRSLRRPHVP